MQDSERIVFIDHIRVIACFLVMLVHASECFYAGSASGLAGDVAMVPDEAVRFWVAFYDGFVARTCVPLFMIVSAYLLVPLKPGQTMGGDIADPAVPVQLAIPLIAVLSYSCCVLATKLISYIPGSKWLIGC